MSDAFDINQFNACPQLMVNIDEHSVMLDGEPLDLHPSETAITNDIALYLTYMRGFELFHGEVELLQKHYFEFTNWMFVSPFLAAIRDMAAQYDHIVFPYPVFGLIYGQSRSGKTCFVETVQKMMTGRKCRFAPVYFTRTGVEQIKQSLKGAPVVVDDISQLRFAQNAADIVKNDQFGTGEHWVHYPAVVFCANEDVKAVAPEVVRRAIICRVQAGLKNMDQMKNSVVRQTQHHIGTAFYREYVKRMFKKMPAMLSLLASNDDLDPPDILAVSAEIICEIIRTYAKGKRPFYIRELTLDDYFGEKVTGAYAIKAIRDAWSVDKKAFVIHRKTGRLRYRAGDVWESSRIAKELPEDLEAVRSNEWIIMNLKQARIFFNINFNKGRWYDLSEG